VEVHFKVLLVEVHLWGSVCGGPLLKGPPVRVRLWRVHLWRVHLWRVHISEPPSPSPSVPPSPSPSVPPSPSPNVPPCPAKVSPLSLFTNWYRVLRGLPAAITAISLWEQTPKLSHWWEFRYTWSKGVLTQSLCTTGAHDSMPLIKFTILIK
jgi:hypothetical protein